MKIFRTFGGYIAASFLGALIGWGIGLYQGHVNSTKRVSDFLSAEISTYVQVLTFAATGKTNEAKEFLESQVAFNIIGLYELSGYDDGLEWINKYSGIGTAALYARSNRLTVADQALDSTLERILGKALEERLSRKEPSAQNEKEKRAKP